MKGSKWSLWRSELSRSSDSTKPPVPRESSARSRDAKRELSRPGRNRRGGRRGLWRPTPDKWGAMRLRTLGRRTGRERVAIVAYIEDGPNLVTVAMNGWADPEPAWWRNLQANSDATVDLADGPRRVRGRAAAGEERERLWSRWAVYNQHLEAYAARRSRQTQIVVLEPKARAVQP